MISMYNISHLQPVMGVTGTGVPVTVTVFLFHVTFAVTNYFSKYVTYVPVTAPSVTPFLFRYYYYRYYYYLGGSTVSQSHCVAV